MLKRSNIKNYLKAVLSGRLKKLYANAAEFRSESENSEYPAAVMRAISSQKSFESFKRDPIYRQILEHVSKEQGERYLDILLARCDGILNSAVDTVFKSDSIGNPIKFWYDSIQMNLSPTTLRYVKVASDLSILFGKNIETVAEIGCGYGGQCLVNEKLLGYKLSYLYDLPFVNQLIERYLNYTLMNGSYRTVVLNQATPRDYDLVISNYAFSELPASLQSIYIDKVLSRAKAGYLTMNSGMGGWRDQGKLNFEQLQALLPKFEVFEEDPLTGQNNYIIVWGHSINQLPMDFKYYR